MVSFFQDKILSGEQQSASISPVYRVLIAGQIRGGSGRELQVIAQTPEEIGIQIDNEWESLVSNGEVPVPLGSSRVGQLAELGARAGGLTRSNQGLTSQVWRGTTPLEIQLPLLLNARENAYNDVVVPFKNLIQLASPYGIGPDSIPDINSASLFGNLIHAPGPTIYDIATNNTSNNIRLKVGRIIEIPSVVITSLQIDIPNRFTAQGHPVEANINVSLRTHHIYLRGDYDRIFGGRDQQLAATRPQSPPRRPATNRGRGFSGNRTSGRIAV